MFDGDHDLTLKALSDFPEEKYKYLRSHFHQKELEIQEIFKKQIKEQVAKYQDLFI